jgi:hypothetical protein
MTILVKFGFELHKTSRICAKGQIGTKRRQICWASNKYINSKEGKFVWQAINT